MPGTVPRPRTWRLALCGWDGDAQHAVAALAATGTMTPAQVLDRSGVALVEARRALGLPCSQMVSRSLDSGDYDAVLFTGPAIGEDGGEDGGHDVERAASTGAALLLGGEAASAHALRSALCAAIDHGVPLTVLHPALRDPGIEELARLAAEPGWQPALLDVTVEAATDLGRLLRIAAALAARLMPGDAPLTTTSTAWGEPARTCFATIETPATRILLRTRHAPRPFVRIAGDAPAGSFDLRIEGGLGYLSAIPADGVPTSRTFHLVRSAWQLEADRALRVLAGEEDDDREAARRTADLLAAIEYAEDGSAPVTLVPRGAAARPWLTLIHGGGVGVEASARGPRSLHLVGHT